MSDDTIPAELNAIHERLDIGEKRMSSMEAELAKNTALTIENTAITKDIKELLDAARLGLKVIGGLGSLVRWGGTVSAGLAAIYGFIYMLLHAHGGPK